MRQRVATAAAAVTLVGGADALALAPPASMKSPLELHRHHRQWHHGHHHHRHHRRNRRWGGSRGTTSVANSAGSDDLDREEQYNGEGGVPGDYSLLGYGGKTPPLERLTLYSDDGWTLSAPQRYSVSDWYENIRTLPGSQVLSRVSSHLAFNGGWAVLVTVAAYVWPQVSFVFNLESIAPPTVFMNLDLIVPFELSGGILGILLAFRTGQSYDRFWEGRTLWARVIGRVRSLARAGAVYVDRQENGENESLRMLNMWLSSYPIALRQHLTGERDMTEFVQLDAQDRLLLEETDNLPITVCLILSEVINEIKLNKEQSAKDLVWWQMENFVHELLQLVGEGEAIAGTPVPLAYSRHTSRLLSVWTFFMPIILLQKLPPLLVPPATLLISWMLLATEEIGHIIEEPFGIHDDRPQILPLKRYCDVVEKDLGQIATTRSWIGTRQAVLGQKPPTLDSGLQMDPIDEDTSKPDDGGDGYYNGPEMMPPGGGM